MSNNDKPCKWGLPGNGQRCKKKNSWEWCFGKFPTLFWPLKWLLSCQSSVWLQNCYFPRLLQNLERKNGNKASLNAKSSYGNITFLLNNVPPNYWKPLAYFQSSHRLILTIFSCVLIVFIGENIFMSLFHHFHWCYLQLYHHSLISFCLYTQARCLIDRI